MITKFKLFEAQQRKHGGGNIFSNNHRSPNLPAGCAMIDVDNISIVDGRINAILEDKHTFKSSLGNPMATGGTWQSKKLLDICSIINADLILQETSTNSIYKFKSTDERPEKIDDLSGYNFLETADRIYVEIRYGRPKAIMFRTEGLRMSDLQSDKYFNAALLLTNTLIANSTPVRLYLVNDIIPDKIYIRKFLPTSTSEKIVTYFIDPINPQSWIDCYDRMGML